MPPPTSLFRRAWIFLLLALIGLPTFLADQAVKEWMNDHRTKEIKDFAGRISHFGDWPFLMAAGAIGIWVAWSGRKKRVARFILLMMVASTLAGIGDNMVRLTTGRARPNAPVEPGWHGMRHEGKWLMGNNRYSSFPSAHTACGVGFFGLLLFRRPVAGAFLLLPGLLIGLSRIVVEAHHLSDVYYGAWFGLLAAWWVAGKWLDKERAGFATRPVIPKSGLENPSSRP